MARKARQEGVWEETERTEKRAGVGSGRADSEQDTVHAPDGDGVSEGHESGHDLDSSASVADTASGSGTESEHEDSEGSSECAEEPNEDGESSDGEPMDDSDEGESGCETERDSESTEEDEGLEEMGVEPDSDNDLSLFHADGRAKTVHPLEAETHRQRILASGVIYISHVPPKMQIPDLRRILTQYGGPCDRIRFNEDEEWAKATQQADKEPRMRRRKLIDGWVEFVDKHDAKKCVKTLNGELIPTRRGSRGAQQMFGMRYLPGFKWMHLMDSLREEWADRKARLRADMSAARQEAKEFSELVAQQRGTKRPFQRGDGRAPGGGDNPNHKRAKSTGDTKMPTIGGSAPGGRQNPRWRDRRKYGPRMIDSLLPNIFPKR